jgi:hypothetical protein
MLNIATNIGRELTAEEIEMVAGGKGEKLTEGDRDIRQGERLVSLGEKTHNKRLIERGEALIQEGYEDNS